MKYLQFIWLVNNKTSAKTFTIILSAFYKVIVFLIKVIIVQKKEIQMVRIIQNYTLYEVIGEGAYGKVYRAVNKLDNKEYAVKVIEVKKFQTNKKLEECTVHEINILTNIEKNKHIITYYDMLKTQNNFYFVYQYCNGGTLQGSLRKEQTIEEKKALLILKQLLQAFQVLNKYNIMHRDLKPDNIFFHNNVLKVGDFGFCKSLQKAEMTKTMLGSPIYMAPQILNGQIYSNKADIWSIGVVLYQMLFGYCPFESNSIPKLIEVLKQTELQFPTDIPVSNEVKTLLKKILTKDPQKRIQWMELFQLKISNEGKLIEEGQGHRISLVDGDKNLLKTVRQITQTEDNNPPIRTYPSPNSINSSTTTASSNGMYSPRGIGVNDSLTRGQTQPDEKPKLQLMKKPQGMVEEGETVPSTSPIRKFTKPIEVPNNGGLKQKVLKFHQDIVRGINICRSMGINNERSTPVFSFFILKTVSERMKAFRDQTFSISQSQSAQARQYKQIFDQQIDDVDYEIAMMRNKVEDFADWKKAVKTRMSEVKSARFVYEIVMFLSGQTPLDNISQNDMRNAIRIKVG